MGTRASSQNRESQTTEDEANPASMSFDQLNDHVRECTQKGQKRDLSNKNLRGLDLRRVQNGSLAHWDFSNSDLRGTQWPPALNNAVFFNTKLQRANFDNVEMPGVDFTNAQLSGAHLWTRSLQQANLEWARWDDGFIIGNEIDAEASFDNETRAGLLKSSGGIYRQLKQIYQRYGRYDLAGEFYYREMECRRKRLKIEAQMETDTARRWKTRLALLDLWLSRCAFGYGERPLRLLGTALLVFLSFSVMYWVTGLSQGLGAPQFFQALYFSAVSFTAVGYGGWVGQNLGWPKYLGALEALLGTLIIALFLVTFTRRYSR